MGESVEEIIIKDELSDEGLEWVNVAYRCGDIFYEADFLKTDVSIAPGEQVSAEKIPPNIYKRMFEKALEFLPQKPQKATNSRKNNSQLELAIMGHI